MIDVTYSIYSSKLIVLLKSRIKHNFSARCSPKFLIIIDLNLALVSLALLMLDSLQSLRKNSGLVFRVSFKNPQAFSIYPVKFFIIFSLFDFFTDGCYWPIFGVLLTKLTLLIYETLGLLADFWKEGELFSWNNSFSEAMILVLCCIVFGRFWKWLFTEAYSGVV